MSAIALDGLGLFKSGAGSVLIRLHDRLHGLAAIARTNVLDQLASASEASAPRHPRDDGPNPVEVPIPDTPCR